MNEIVSYAKYQATEDFRKNGVKKWSIQDLHHRDEESGTVSFIDPDTGEDLHSREKAQAWINSMNSQIDESYNKKVRDNATKMFNNARPVFELLQFAPTYQKMDDMTKDVFEDIVAPYALADAQGNIMGYSCNLNAAAQQAASIVGRFKQARQQPQQQPQQQAVPQQQQPKAPAMDMKTGASSSPEDDEPKTLEEAMRRINEKNRSKSNG